MTFRLFEAPLDEPSRFVGFAGNRLDRQSENRADDSVEKALADPSARLLLMQPGRVLLKVGASASADFSWTEAATLSMNRETAILLGFNDGRPVLAVETIADPELLPDGIKAIDIRSVYVQGLVGADRLGEIAQAASLLAWHASHRFCSKCGNPSEMRAGGYRRHCPNCSADHFPRTDPVAIVLAVTGDRCIMGRGRHFAPGMYSALAGFIEPGETIEGAVRRETLEEAGVRLGRVVYHASQPWPFPHTLMIGCFGEALDEEIHADPNELEACRWFGRDEVRSMLSETHPDLKVPPAGAIAHHLIRAWAYFGE